MKKQNWKRKPGWMSEELKKKKNKLRDLKCNASEKQHYQSLQEMRWSLKFRNITSNKSIRKLTKFDRKKIKRKAKSGGASPK
jgi:hypothetical protein